MYFVEKKIMCWLGIMVLVDNDVMVSMHMYSLLEQQVQESNSNIGVTIPGNWSFVMIEIR